ncbi:hypothetical protein CBR_g41128 [Chara braunii]|uniref:Reverse transcriptase domain-containing protein n=1 Tax=Chara braunii TaxID=69332 RepID=A0A388LVF5_CHABU|nr:hypothetical protein CBR_g41128 [Chara braunii]|eukprot:GBG86223.1 hypothetical protein CBR_g41128 [Chara braunii]
MVDTRRDTSTMSYTKEEEAKMAAILQERKEKREAKKKALQEEQAAKLKKLEEEMAREKERIKKEEEEKLKEVEEEENEGPPLERRRGQHSGSKGEEMEKRISEWVANLSLGEEEEVAMYIPKDDQEAALKKWEAEKDMLKRQAMEDEQRMEWKLAMMREKKRRLEAASEAVKELEEVQKLSLKLTPQVDLERKVEILAQSVEHLAKIQEQQYEFSRSQDIAMRSMRMGFRDFARELIGAVGAEVNHRLKKTERFCVGAIEGVKVAAPKEEEARPPRREPVKVSPDQHVLIAIHALRDEAANFARSLVRAVNCNGDAVAYSASTSLTEFMKLLRERLADVARSVKASDRLQTIHARKWKSARALKSTMDELIAVPDHGVTDTQLVGLFYRAIPEALRGHFFAKSEDPTTTYDSLSREVVAFEAKSASVSTFWHKDLDKGKQWKGHNISGQVKTKDSLVLTLDEGSVDEIPYDQIEWGLEEDDSGVGQGRTYAAVAAGGRPQGGGRGQGQGGRASGSRFQGDQGVGGRGGNRQAGGRGQGPPQNRPRNRLVKKEKLEEQVFVAYVRPVTEPKEEKPVDPAIAKLLEEFKDLIEPPTGTVPRPIQHRIEIEPGSRTPKGVVYRMSPRELEELRKQLDELLEKGWIRPSSSPFGAPVLFVPKKEGEPRMCIDYRGLNAITVKNAEPLPRIDDLLDRVQGAKYFSKIDLKSGSHQIEVHPDDQYKTAFRTRYGHYEFIVMPFGLTNAPATFQRCMNDLFTPWLDKFVVVYLDDILVFSRTLKEHQGHLRQVLEKLREANFKINAKKCDWAKTQVLYLGHVLDGDGVKPEDSKIAAIRDWPTPRTLTELRSFLGLANYYRKFVRNFSTIAAPLRRLLRKETIWKWDKDCTSAMKKLKQALIEYPVLKVVDPSLPFVVTTGACQYGIGVVLQQDDGNGYRPVEFMSARMPSEKVATSTYERELFALRQALDHWKHYLLGRHFKVYSDHETLRWLKTQAKITPKLTRWAAKIDQYDFELFSDPYPFRTNRETQSVMDQKSGETDEAYQAPMLLLITEAKQRSDAVAAAAKKKAEDTEKARLLAIEQQRQHDEAASKAADEERVQCREKIFNGEKALLTMDWRSEAENGKMEESENKIALLLSHLTDLLATCLTQQEDIHSLDDGQTQLQQTTTQQLEQWICTAANHSISEPRETAPSFDRQEIFCDSTKTDPISWFRKFELTLQLHYVKEHKHHGYSRSGGACQAWLDNLLSKCGVVAANFHTKISWDDLKAAWHKRFQVESSKIKAMDKLMVFEQGTLPSVDWIAEYQRLTSAPDIQMGFKAIKHYFISRSCPTLGNALTHVEDTLTTPAKLFDKAAQIIVTNKEAKNLQRSSVPCLSKDQHRPKVAVVVAATPNDQTSEVVSTTEGDRLAAAREGGRPGKGRGSGKTKTNTASSPRPGSAAPTPWSYYGLSEQAFKARTRFRYCLWCNNDLHDTMACQSKGKSKSETEHRRE